MIIIEDLYTVQVEIAAAADANDDGKEDAEQLITSNCRVCSRLQRNGIAFFLKKTQHNIDY